MDEMKIVKEALEKAYLKEIAEEYEKKKFDLIRKFRFDEEKKIDIDYDKTPEKFHYTILWSVLRIGLLLA